LPPGSSGLPKLSAAVPEVSAAVCVSSVHGVHGVPGVPGVPGVAAVICQPLLLTLFAHLWSHESDTELSAPTVSQSAFCLVSCFRIESANTVCMFVVDIPVTNAVAKRTNTTKV